jgi:uncharacterized protein YcnI
VKKRIISGLVAVASLAVPALAGAHVTVQPKEVAAGGFTRLDVRVPNETDDAATNKVELKMPDGFASASYEPVPGWTVEVAREKLDQPIQTDDGEITEQVSTITWTATDPSAAIPPGAFQDFGLSVGLPDSYQEGDVLTFPAVQTYDNGDVVRWIGPPDADEPAPQVTLTAAEADHDAAPVAAAAVVPADGDDDSSGAPTWLAVLALVVGALGVALGGAALRGRRAG